MYGYIGWRIIVPAAFGAPVNILLWGMLVVALALPFVVIMARFNGVQAAWVDWAAWVGYLSFGFLTLLFAFVAAKDIVLLAVAGYQKVAHLFSGSGGADSAGVDPGRRQMVTNVVNLGLLDGIGKGDSLLIYKFSGSKTGLRKKILLQVLDSSTIVSLCKPLQGSAFDEIESSDKVLPLLKRRARLVE